MQRKTLLTPIAIVVPGILFATPCYLTFTNKTEPQATGYTRVLKSLAFLCLLIASTLSHAATAIVTPPRGAAYDASGVAGPHHRFHTVERHDPISGAPIPSGFVELASGLNYLDPQGQWAPTREEFQIVEGHAVAVQGPHRVILSPNARTPGAVDMLTPEGRRLRAHVLGLSLYNPATGASELIAEVQDRQGELVAPNQVVFPDAFDSIQASLRYTYTAAGLEQDVILHERPFIPAEFQAPGCRLEVLTEFLELPQPRGHVMRAMLLGQEGQ